MKTATCSGDRKFRVISGLCAAGSALILCAPFPSPAINAVAPGALTTQAQAQPYQASPAPRYSPGVADVLKMVEARIDPEVLKAYVQASPVAYKLNAS